MPLQHAQDRPIQVLFAHCFLSFFTALHVALLLLDVSPKASLGHDSAASTRSNGNIFLPLSSLTAFQLSNSSPDSRAPAPPTRVRPCSSAVLGRDCPRPRRSSPATTRPRPSDYSDGRGIASGTEVPALADCCVSAVCAVYQGNSSSRILATRRVEGECWPGPLESRAGGG